MKLKVVNIKQAVIENIKTIVEYGDFTLASGKKSHFYIDMALVANMSDGLQNCADAILEAIDPDILTLDSIGGPVLGAVPLAAAVLARLDVWHDKKELKSFCVRKDQKDHGKPDVIEGYCEPGMNVILLEDVVTTAGSVGRTIDAIQARGVNILYVLTILDRQQGGEANLAARGIKLKSICTIEEVTGGTSK